MALDLEAISSQYATCGVVAHTSLSGATICGWIKPESVVAGQTNVILNISANATNVARMSMRLSSADASLRLDCRRVNADSVSTGIGAALSAGVIYFVAGVADYVNGTLRVYFGIPGGTFGQSGATVNPSGWTATSDSNASAGAAIGGRADGAASNFFDGQIEDLRFYQSALTLAQLQAIFYGESIAATPRNRWEMTTVVGAAGTITDTQGNNNGTGQASPVYAANIRPTYHGAIIPRRQGALPPFWPPRLLARSSSVLAVATGSGGSSSPAQTAAGKGGAVATAFGTTIAGAQVTAGKGVSVATGKGGSSSPAQVTAGNGGAVATGSGGSSSPAQATAGKGVGSETWTGSGGSTGPVQTTAGKGAAVATGSGGSSAPAQVTAGKGVSVATGSGGSSSPAQVTAGKGGSVATGSGGSAAPPQQTRGYNPGALALLGQGGIGRSRRKWGRRP